jgi:hypothetical protein
MILGYYSAIGGGADSAQEPSVSRHVGLARPAGPGQLCSIPGQATVTGRSESGLG